MARFINLATALEKFDEYPWPQLGSVLLLSLVYYVLKALRWHYLLRVIDIRLPLRRSLLVYIAGQWFAVTPAGEFVRAFLLTRYGFSFSRGSAAVSAQVFFDFLSLAMIASLSVFWYNYFAAAVLAFTAALIVGMLLFVNGPLVWQGRRLPFAAGPGTRWGNFYQYSRQLLGWRPLLVGLALGLPTVVVGSVILFEVARGYQIAAGLGQSAYIYSLSQLVGALSMLPHGLGALEGTSVALFHYAGVDTADAASAIVLFRLATVGWGLILGGVALLALRTPLAGPLVPKVG